MEDEYIPLLKFWFSVKNFTSDKLGVYSNITETIQKNITETIQKNITETIPCFWFSKKKETDDYIQKNFSELLIRAENHKLNYWKSSVHGHLALIILLDQFSRHIYRNDDIQMYKNDIIAFQYAKEFLLDNKDKDLTNLEKIMILLPYRHQENISAYQFIINYMSKEQDLIWDNFKKHTIRNYEYLIKNNRLLNRPENRISYINDPKFESILENKWNSVMQTFDLESNIYDTLLKFIVSNLELDNNLIIVSLSGGVDSVVILAVLSKIIKNIFRNTT
jgi:uncharacterized protein (DUF924 family)